MGSLKQIEKAKEMVGKKYLRFGDEVVFEEFKVNGEWAFLTISGEKITSTVYDLNQRLTELKTHPDNLPSIPNQPLPIKLQTVDESSLRSLRDSLMRNIEMVSKDKEFVPQAREVSKSAQTLINLAKTELEIKKALNEGQI